MVGANLYGANVEAVSELRTERTVKCVGIINTFDTLVGFDGVPPVIEGSNMG